MKRRPANSTGLRLLLTALLPAALVPTAQAVRGARGIGAPSASTG